MLKRFSDFQLIGVQLSAEAGDHEINEKHYEGSRVSPNIFSSARERNDNAAPLVAVTSRRR